nr:ATP-dependent DNA helicase pfh1-like [Coffea arabica]
MVRGHKTASFREACLELGLLESDSYIEQALEEAAHFQTPYMLRSLFAMLLFYCYPKNPKHLWQSFEEHLSSDYKRSSAHRHCTPIEIKSKVLQDINVILEHMGKNLDDYHFLEDSFTSSHAERLTKEIQSETTIPIDPENLLLAEKLNSSQRHAFDLILDSVSCSKGQAFFVDGPGGTGKTFLYRALLVSLRSQGYVAIAVATSGVAASLLPGGRTAHSRFKIPLDFSKQKACQLSKQSSVARLIVDAKLILWDEASMAKKEAIEAFHCLLTDIMESDLPFGGKTIIFGGDFRQTLPVIEHLPPPDLVQSTLLCSHLWSHMCKLQLGTNMRAALDPAFSAFLLRVGEGVEPVDEHGQTSLSPHMVIPYQNKQESLDRCVLCPKNSSVDEINEMMIAKFPGCLHRYISCDRTVDRRYQADYQDFLNSLNPKGQPPHELLLKENCPTILLRNVNPTDGLCNGTRLICRQLADHTISAEIVSRPHRGKKGQTLDYVGIYLREPVFSHGQLYVALSKARNSSAVKVLIAPGTSDDVKTYCKTRTVVFQDIFKFANI